jgi:hypothetical protein
VTCAFAKRIEALACCDVFVASDWIQPNSTRWRAIASVGSASHVIDLSIEQSQAPPGQSMLILRNQKKFCDAAWSRGPGLWATEGGL